MGKYYTLYKETNFSYPDDMKKILDYLHEHGSVTCDDEMIEEMYERFSDSEYCAQWMCVEDRFLEEFAEWLDDF